MQATAQGWLVYQLTGSKVLLGTVAAVGTLPMLVFSLWGGSVADRHPKRTVIFYTQVGMMLTAFLFAALVGSGHIQTWHILVLAAASGVAMAFDMPARQAFMVEMTSHEDLMNAISLNSSIVNGARVVGPAVAGLLMASVGITWCFILNGVSFIAVIEAAYPGRLQVCGRPSSRAHFAAALWRGGRLWLVVCGAAARLRYRHSSYQRNWLWHAAQCQWIRGTFGGADSGNLRWPRAATADDSRRAVVVLGHAGAIGHRALVSAGAPVPGRWGLGNAALFLNHKHAHPKQRVQRDARAGDGHLGTGIRRHDAFGWH